MGGLEEEPEGVSYAINEVTASPSASFMVWNKICCISEFVFLQFPKNTCLYQLGDSFPKDYVIGVCKIFPLVLLAFILSTHAAYRLQ